MAKIVEIGDRVYVTHRDGTKRTGQVVEILPETPRGPRVIQYKVGIQSMPYAAYPSYGDLVSLDHELEKPKVPAVRFLDPEDGKLSRGEEEVEILDCPGCHKQMETHDPRGLAFVWVCTIHKDCTLNSKTCIYSCRPCGEGWCGNSELMLRGQMCP